MLKRAIILEKNKNYLLLGPRQTGKSTLVKRLLGPQDLYINLLLQAEYVKYSKDPGRLHAEIMQHAKQGPSLCVIDEIQRLPHLLNDVHDLIESTHMSFILTGSSARKLRQEGVNLLAGRALHRSFFPLTRQEIGEDFDLEKALIYGTLPRMWNGTLSTHADIKDFLNSYALVYLQEEIQREGLVRRVDTFPRFLDIAALNDGQLVNYSTMARDCGVSAKTVQNFYRILEDTFLAFRLDGWHKSVRRQLTAHPKYFFFDCGVTNALCLSVKEELNGVERGRRFEQFVFLQLFALNSYLQKGYYFYHWRDKNGIEVDFILTKNNEIRAAIEIKSSPTISKRDYKSLEIFRTEHNTVPCFVLGCEGRKRELSEGILYMSWENFIDLFSSQF